MIMVRGLVYVVSCMGIIVLCTSSQSLTEAWMGTNAKRFVPHFWTTSRATTGTCNHQRRLAPILKASPNRPEQPEDKEEDWRDVRAKLLQQYYKSEESQQLEQQQRKTLNQTFSTSPTNATTSTDSTTISNKWAYDSGSVVECGSLIVSHPVQDFSCGGLKQQYFHKCVVLVVKHDAHFTKGVILNRCSRSMMPEQPLPTSNRNNKTGTTTDTLANTNTSWTMHFAGDVQGWNSPHPDYTCLHRLQSPKALELSLPVVKDIHHTTWALAQILVEQGEAKPEDFWLGCGYAGWWPKQLQQELERNNWFMVATDSESIVELLEQSPASASQEDNNERGIAMWKHCMNLVHKNHIVEEYATKQSFEDVMLEEWIRYQTTKNQQANQPQQTNGMIIQPPDAKPDAPSIQVGTIYRASHPIVLDEQVFHESLLLVMKQDERGTIGAILNRPSAKGVTLQNTTLPLRYGGRYGIEKEGKQEIWLHCGNEALRNAKVGHPIVPNDATLVWKCTREDAETAVEIGLAQPCDFMVIMGLTLWEKNPPPEGFGMPLTKTNLEKDFSPVPKSKITSLWNELLLQEVSTESTLAKNLKYAKNAYYRAGNRPGDKNLDGLLLADDALQRWIKMFLLKPNEKL